MLNVPNHDAKDVKSALGITDSDDEVINELLDIFHDRKPRISWMLQRIWVDERLNDNARCFTVFLIGRICEYNKWIEEKGGEVA